MTWATLVALEPRFVDLMRDVKAGLPWYGEGGGLERMVRLVGYGISGNYQPPINKLLGMSEAYDTAMCALFREATVVGECNRKYRCTPRMFLCDACVQGVREVGWARWQQDRLAADTLVYDLTKSTNK